MKRMFFLLMFIGMEMGMTMMAGAGSSKIREETRFLTDKMAHELGLTVRQYNDVYEINYDFVNAADRVMGEVMRGYEWALEEYYEILDIRNDDLRWVLSDAQYRRLMGADYFYRPIYVTGGRWTLRVYARYPNRTQFYFGLPRLYHTYCGAHRRPDFRHVSYYRNRHTGLQHHTAPLRMKDQRNIHSYRRSDFGTVHIRPNSSIRPSHAPVRPAGREKSFPAASPDRNDRHRSQMDSQSRPATPPVRRNNASPTRNTERKNVTNPTKRNVGNTSRSEERGERVRR